MYHILPPVPNKDCGTFQQACMKYAAVLHVLGARGGTVVEALRYKPEGGGIDS
jgi:hypothetical protein